ncbi:hypothetical protein V3C99_014968 [Haemonchus contortus]
MDKFADLKVWVADVLEREHRQKPFIAKDEFLGDITGYMSNIVRFHLTWPSNSQNLPLTVIAKIPTAESLQKNYEDTCGTAPPTSASANADLLQMVHEIEISSYAMLSKGRCQGLAIPFIYGSLSYSSAMPCILIEDIHPSKVYDLVDGFNDEQLYKVVDQLVALHVYCFTHDDWKTLGMEAKEMTESYKHYVEMYELMRGLFMTQNPQLKSGLTLLHDNYTRNKMWYIDELQRYKKEGVLRTYVHGDLWTANILWRGDELAAIIDWSLCHSGSLTEDLLRVLVTCCSVERRKRMTRPLLEYYYKKMQTKLTEKGINMPFPFDDLEKDYHRTLPFISGQTVFAVGLWLQTGVIRKGTSNDEERVQEMIARLHSIVEETVSAHKWRLPEHS